MASSTYIWITISVEMLWLGIPFLLIKLYLEGKIVEDQLEDFEPNFYIENECKFIFGFSYAILWEFFKL